MVADTVEMLPAMSPVREAAKPRPAPTTASWADVSVELGACHGGDSLRRLAAAEGWGRWVALTPFWGMCVLHSPGNPLVLHAPMQLFEPRAVPDYWVSVSLHLGSDRGQISIPRSQRQYRS